MDEQILQLAWAQLWQVTLVAIVVAFLVRSFARRRAHLAHVLWLVVLLKCVTPPIWTSPSGVFCWLQTEAVEQPLEPTTKKLDVENNHELINQNIFESPEPVQIPLRPRLSANVAPPIDAERIRSIAVDALPVSNEKTVQVAAPQTEQESATGYWGLFWCWLVGTTAIATLASVRWFLCLRSIRRAGWSHDETLDRLVARLSKSIGLRRQVQLKITKGRTGPAVIGIFRPTLLLPQVIVDGKTPEELEPILAHELIHLRRGDLWVGLFQVVVQALWWFHPLVWLVNRLLTRDAERCCDEEVIAELGCDPARYARCLIDVLELKQTLKPIPVFPGVRPVEVTSKRLERIMKLGQGSLKRTPWWCWVAMFLMASMMLPGAAFVASAKDKSKKRNSKKRHDAPIQSAPSDSKSKVFRQTYRVADLLKETQLVLKSSEKQAKEFFIERIKNLSGAQWDNAERLGVDFDMGEDGQIAVDYINLQRGGTSMLYWSGNKLVAFQNKSDHAKLESAIETIRKNGLEQITFEIHTVVAPPELINTLSSNWVIPQTVISPEESAGPQQLDIQLDRPLPDKDTKPSSTARMSVEKNLPVMLEILDTKRRDEILATLDQNTKANIMQAPKVTLFNGQSAVVQDSTQRPFVVGMRDGEPQIRVVTSGWKMNLRPMLRGKKLVWLDYEMSMSNIRSVDQTEIKTKGGVETIALQIPEVAKTQIDSSVELPLGKTLLVGGLKTAKVKDETRSLLVLIRTSKADVESTRTGKLTFGDEVHRSADLTREWTPAKVQRVEPKKIALAQKEADSNITIRLAATKGGIFGNATMTEATHDRIHARLKRIGIRLDIVAATRIREAEKWFELSVKNCRVVIKDNDDDVSARLSADQGTLKLGHDGDSDLGFDLQGRAAIIIGNAEEQTIMQADQIVHDFTGKLDLIGHARVINHEQGFELFADKILCGEPTVLEGNARLLRLQPDGTIDRVVAKRIKWHAEGGKIEVDGVNGLDYSVKPAAAIQADDQESDVLPTPYYIEDDVQYFPAGPEFKLGNEAKSKEQFTVMHGIVDGKVTIGPPTDEEVMNALRKKHNANPEGGLPELREVKQKTLRIVKEKIATYADRPRNYPLIGPAQLHHAHYKCTVYMTNVIKVGWPKKHQREEDVVEVVYVHVTHFRRVSQLLPEIDEENAFKPAAQPKDWNDVSEMRKELAKAADKADAKVRDRLTTPILLKFDNAPLKQVMEQIGKAAGVNILLDQRGLAAEGLKANEPVTINLAKPIRIASALKLILAPLNLKYEIQDEVVKVTSESNNHVYTKVYNVADLVIPIAEVVKLDGQPAPSDGNTEPQFDTLIELIQSTVSPQSWDEVGGPGSVSAFETSLSLVVSQSQELHEKIEELISQLRRLQELQVVCELRTYQMSREKFNKLWDEPWKENFSVLSETEVFFLLQVLDKQKGVERFGAPKITLFNGQQLESSIDFAVNKKSAFSKRLHLVPVVSADRRMVRIQLSAKTKPSDKVKELVANMKDGETVVMDLSDQIGANNQRTIVLIKPRVVVVEEEEELLSESP